jgi:hypothetical protein
MTMHQCPKCDLRFTWRTELDDHCRTDHPDFHHEYPVRGVHHADGENVEPKPAKATPVRRPAAKASDVGRNSAILATWWTER